MHETQKQTHETQPAHDIMSLNDMFVVEWCDEQRCFHVDNLEETVLKNMHDYINGEPLNFSVIGIVGSENEAWNLVEKLQAERAEQCGVAPPAAEPRFAANSHAL